MGVRLDKQHFSLTSCQEVRDICKPLFDNFGFTHFHFRRTFNDRSRAVLCTNPEWVKYFYDTKQYDHYGIYEELKPNGEITICDQLFNSIHSDSTYSSMHYSVSGAMKNRKPSFVLWQSLYDLPVFNFVFEEAKYFNIDHGITMTDNDEHSCSFYQIGTTPEKAHLINFYLNNYDILRVFIKYFKDRGAHLIEQAEKNRILANDSITQPHFLEKNNIPFIENEKFDRFFKQIQYSAYRVEGLSSREMQLIQYLLKGYTAKQIANALQLSHRTVEFYIANIKTKLQCFTKAQLIQRLHELTEHSLG